LGIVNEWAHTGKDEKIAIWLSIFLNKALKILQEENNLKDLASGAYISIAELLRNKSYEDSAMIYSEAGA